jgi:hypothetical protein
MGIRKKPKAKAKPLPRLTDDVLNGIIAATTRALRGDAGYFDELTEEAMQAAYEWARLRRLDRKP